MGDPEIEAMSSVANALAGIDEHAQGRVLRWAVERFGITLDKPDGQQASAGDGRGTVDVVDGDNTDENGAQTPVFEHFADLYDAAGPSDKEGRLLVAAYWRQHVQGQSSFQSHELNRDLRDLGHAIDHISEGLAASINKKPALVLQLRKAGNSQQARKTYKLSGEGAKAVEAMIRVNR